MGLSSRPSVRECVLTNINVYETSGPIAIKIYLKHHLGEGKAALGLGQIGSELLLPRQQ